jgi:predicted TIM-barrel fold metal-dependent hydrolase
VGADRRYVVISTDAHGGADIDGYKPFLEKRWHDDFDAWRNGFNDPWGDVGDHSRDNLRVGVASFLAPVNWDTDLRSKDLESEGVVGEVIFPNTVPPFYPSGVLTAPNPRTPEEYESRWAGIRAHNRWLAAFSQELPGRRAGMAQIFFNDIDDAVSEIRWAKDNGLKGVLLPSDHQLTMVNLYYPRLDPIWAVCEELEMPVHRHGIFTTEGSTSEAGPAAAAVGIYEAWFYGQRGLAQMILAGVFDRFPNLKLVFTEARAAWVVGVLRNLDALCDGATREHSMSYVFAREAVVKLKRRPSEYFATNCFLGSFLTPQDIEGRHQIGLDNIMWGQDYPHHEGTWPYTREALRANFSDVPEAEVRKMIAETAARIYGFDLKQLQQVADRIGPTVDEIAKPLAKDEWPTDSMCCTLSDTYAGVGHFELAR